MHPALLLALLLSTASNAAPPPVVIQPMVHQGTLGPYAMTREVSGTAWQPESTPMDGLHWQRGGWNLMAHGFVTLGAVHERGPRGDSSAAGTGMAMVMASRQFGRRTLSLRAMGTLEPLMGARGYPLLLQNGETADGINPLVDRQHPHDTVMELSMTLSQALDQGRSVFIYLAPVGEPAIGPAAFMHRASAASTPLAPISHHWLDSTHVSNGVVTVGFTTREGFKAEASVFNGREPDQHRWGLQAPALNSFAGRLTVNPTRDLSVQFSGARLDSPEQLHGNLDVVRMTASTTYNRDLRDGQMQITAAWGRSKRLLPDLTERVFFEHEGHAGHVHYATIDVVDNSLVQDAFLLEGTADLPGRHVIGGRLEYAKKDGLFPSDDARHADNFGVSRVSISYLYDLPIGLTSPLAAGLTASVSFIPTELETEYGSTPVGVMVFLKAQLGR